MINSFGKYSNFLKEKILGEEKASLGNERGIVLNGGKMTRMKYSAGVNQCSTIHTRKGDSLHNSGTKYFSDIVLLKASGAFPHFSSCSLFYLFQVIITCIHNPVLSLIGINQRRNFNRVN